MIYRGFSLAVLSLCAVSAYGDTITVPLGTAGDYAVLAGSTITNTGASVVFGDIGVAPGTAITGFPPGVVTPPGTIDAGNAASMQAQTDLASAYAFAAGEPCGTSLTGQDLGGLTLTPGVYCFASTAELTGTLTLDGLGATDPVFIFQIGSALTTASASSVLFTDGSEGNDLFWQVGSSATLGTTTDFAGNILAMTSITLDTGADITCGRALANNGAVTMDTNDVSINPAACSATTSGGSGDAVPEPGTAPTAGIGLLLGLISRRWRPRTRAS